MSHIGIAGEQTSRSKILSTSSALSHYLNMRRTGYQDLPVFPALGPGAQYHRLYAVSVAQKPNKYNNNNCQKLFSLLLDLDDLPPIGPIMKPSLGGFLAPGTTVGLMPQNAANRFGDVKHRELLDKLSGHGIYFFCQGAVCSSFSV